MSLDHLKLTAYFGERSRSGHRFTVDAMLDLFGDHAVEHAVVRRGIAGFGPRHVLRTDVSLSLAEDPPIVVTAVDTAARLEPLADAVLDLVGRGLVTAEPAGHPAEISGPSTRLTVFVGRGVRSGTHSAHLAVGELMRAHGMSGATAYVGVDGTVRGRRERAGFFSRNIDVPALVVAAGPTDAAVWATAALGELPGVHTVTAAPTQLCKVGGQSVSAPTPPADPDAHQRLVVQTASSRAHDGVPVHRALVAALRALRLSSGVTVLRGVWGFHGAGPPMVDQLFQLGRGTPVTTTIVDTPANIAWAFDIVDSFTGDHGMVTCDVVPATVSIDDGRRRGNFGVL